MHFGSFADKDSRDWIARSMPIPDIALSLFLRLRLRDIPRSVNEKLRGGLRVRFFNVTIPTGTWISGCLTRSTFSSGRLAENLNAEPKKSK